MINSETCSDKAGGGAACDTRAFKDSSKVSSKIIFDGGGEDDGGGDGDLDGDDPGCHWGVPQPYSHRRWLEPRVSLQVRLSHNRQRNHLFIVMTFRGGEELVVSGPVSLPIGNLTE